MTDPNAELTAAAEKLRGLAEACDATGRWMVGERFMWKVRSTIPGMDGWWRTVDNDDGEVCRLGEGDHPDAESSVLGVAALIAALGPDFARKTADQWDGIARRHTRYENSIGRSKCYLCGTWTPDGCPDLADALAVARTLGGVEG